MTLTLADFESIDNLLIQKFVDYDLIKLKLDELNKKLMDYSVFRDHLLTTEYLQMLKEFDNNSIQKVFEDSFMNTYLMPTLVNAAKMTDDWFSAFQNIRPELQNDDFRKTYKKMVDHKDEIVNKIKLITDKENQNQIVINKLPGLLEPANISLKERQQAFEEKIKEVDTQFAGKVRNRIILSKVIIFAIAAIFYILTEFLPSEFEDKFKAYIILFHLALFGLAFFIVEPNSEKIKQFVKRKIYLNLNASLRQEFLSIELALVKKCRENGVQYHDIPELMNKFRHFSIFVDLSNQKLKELKTHK